MESTVTIEVLDALEAPWRALMARANLPTVFQHPAWHRAWWDVFGKGGTPAFYAVRDPDGELRGVAPMLRQPDGSLAFSGDPEICDYMDVVVAAGDEPAVLAALFAHWRTEGVPALHLWGLRDDSPTLSLLRCGEGVPAAACEQEAVAPRIPLPGDWEGYLAQLSKKDRHELRRKLRRLESSGHVIDFSVVSEPAAIDANMDEFFRLHTISRQDKAEFMTLEMQEFFRQVAHAFAEEGMTRLFMMRFGARAVAALLAFEGEELAVWNSGFDPEFSHLSIGLLSKVKAIQWAQEHGHPWVDFLRGREPYKYDLGGQDLRIFRCRIEAL